MPFRSLLSMLLALLMGLTSFAQTEVTYPYNPDSNNDNYVDVLDVLDILGVYDSEFYPGAILIDGQPLEVYLSDLLEMINQLQVQIDAQAGILDVTLTDTQALLFTFSNGSTFTSPPILGPELPNAGELDAGQFLQWTGSEWILAQPAVGCTDPEACNFDPSATVADATRCHYLDACGACNGPGQIYECGCADIPEGDCDCNGNQLDALGVCGGGCTADIDGDGVCDDGDACIGQADECGVCNGPGAIYDCGCSPIPEGFCDCTGTPDADGDGICDDVDDCVGELDVTGVCNGGCETDLDGDGICDDDGFDTCDGTLDVCGVCNGPGPIYACGCTELPEGDCDCLGNQPNAEGDCPTYLADNDGDGIYDELLDPCLGQTTYTYHDVTYNLVQIAGRCWFRENLRTTMNRSGVPIPNVTDFAEWNATNAPAYCAYNNDETLAETYGYLYNGYAASADNGVFYEPALGLCPSAWDPPTHDEWLALLDTFGGADIAGGALKEAGTTHWSAPNTGATNASGFTALPAGERPIVNNDFEGFSEHAIFWAKGNVMQSLAWSQDLFHTNAASTAVQHLLRRGHAVRCLRAVPVLGCTQPNYLEYNPLANVNDNSCATPAIPGCMDEAYYEYDPNAMIDDGSCSNLLGCGPEDVMSFDDHDYSLVTIGDQCWFQENLRSEHYANGDAIFEIQDNNEWTNLNVGAWCSNNNDITNSEIYGHLYNWYAVDDGRGLCPADWHVPTDEEWTALTDLFGGNEYAGPFLKSSPTDSPAWDGTNESGFSALPGGYRYYGHGGFNLAGGNIGLWWSASLDGMSDAWGRVLYSGYDSFSREDYYHRWGISVRCVRD